jgi:predicted dehydrogenase
MARVGVAVVGAGFMGGVHCEALRRAGCEVVGVLAASEADTLRFVEAVAAPKGYRSLGELLDDPAVHSVHVATPNRLHFEMVKAALEAGKHVLCEKPLAIRARQTAERWRGSARGRPWPSTTTCASTRCAWRRASAYAAGSWAGSTT